jgi:hypothetical protein
MLCRHRHDSEHLPFMHLLGFLQQVKTLQPSDHFGPGQGSSPSPSHLSMQVGSKIVPPHS